MNNNMGATTRVQYASSTKFYLRRQGRRDAVGDEPAVPCARGRARSEVIDHVGRTKLTTTYRYHHGYYDGREREFRGFGRVDQFDTESFADFAGAGLHETRSRSTTATGARMFRRLKRERWFHTGVYFDADRGSTRAS